MAAAIAAATVLSIATPARPSELDDERQRLQQVRSERAQAAARIDALQASEAQTKQALDALDADVAGQEILYANAKRKAEEAAAAAQAAHAEEAAKQAELDRLAADTRKAALAAYVDPPDELGMALDVQTATDAVVRRAVRDIVARRAVDVLDEFGAASEDLGWLRYVADQKAKKAAAQQEAADAQLQSLQESLARQRRVLGDVEDRLDSALAEAAALSSLDSRLSADLAMKQAELAARLARAQALSERAGGGPFAAGSPGFDASGAAIVSVGGIRVSSAIAGQVAAMLDAARGAGINLGGSGYRSSAGQIATRRANCGSSRYALYSMPPSRCRPPTARPGKSMHERGLAIDITCDGALISSRGNRCFRWLANNAWRYGLKNLPSEPWHWSTNGR